VLEDLASATAGALSSLQMKDITHSFAAIEDELRSQYAVSIQAQRLRRRWRYRSIEITALKKDLQSPCPSRYYAPRQ